MRRKTWDQSSLLTGMRFNPSKSIGMKLFLFFFVSVFVIVSVVGWQSFRTSKESILAEVSSSTEQTIIQSRKNLDLIFRSYKDYSLQFISDESFLKDLRTFIGTTNQTYEQMEQQKKVTTYLYNTLTSVDYVNSVSLFSLDGSMISSTYLKNFETITKPAWFDNAVKTKGEDIWLPPSKEPYYAGKSSFGQIRVLRDYNGPIAILLVEIDVQSLSTQLTGMKLITSSVKEGNDIFMLDPVSRKIIYSGEANQIGTSTDFVIPASSKELTSGSFTMNGNDGLERLALYDQSQVTGWYLVGEVLTKDLLKRAEKILTVIYIALALSALIAIILGAIMARMFATPLIQLKNMLNEGAKGNLAVRVSVRSQDEIGELGLSFNQMMESILSLVKQTDEAANRVMTTALRLTEASNQAAISAGEISGATEHIAHGASSLALEAEKGSEMTVVIDQQMGKVVESNTEMNRSAKEANLSSEQGTIYMEDLMEKTKSTESITRDMMEKVSKLKESTSSIHNILQVMTRLTQQTNILSLNATIEAARAGASGQGFMVVAGEVRKLAEQSKDSIEVVGAITRQIQEEITSTVGTLTEAYPLYQSQAEAAKQTNSILLQVREQMGEFIQRSNGVAHSVNELNNAQKSLNDTITSVSAVSEETSASAEQVASVSSSQLDMSQRLVDLSVELNTLSNELQKSLSSFRI
ncbi:methyl-accepting chemotaxis protein [Paenibacillus sp. SI8]|uniref:methyl-accepting chemotaxis protein n=1 Tax=unclassified Paenibacillus TaxID=185978 RepID=UPI003467777D